jgi:hypothetical protein
LIFSHSSLLLEALLLPKVVPALEVPREQIKKLSTFCSGGFSTGYEQTGEEALAR